MQLLNKSPPNSFQGMSQLILLKFYNKLKMKIVVKLFIYTILQYFKDNLKQHQQLNIVKENHQIIYSIKIKGLPNKRQKQSLNNYLKSYSTVILEIQQIIQFTFYIIIKSLKFENLVFSEKENLNSIKLTDLGLNTAYRIQNLTSINNFNYYSPELITQKEFTFTSDIWAFGIILYYLNFNSFPFDGRTKQNIQQNVFQLKYKINEEVNPILRDLLQQIFVKDPDSRIKIQGIIDHPYLKQQNKYNLSFHSSSNKLNLNFLRLNSRNSFRKKTNSQRFDSEENNSSMKRIQKQSSLQKQLEKEQSILNPLQPKQYKCKVERKRCLSHMIVKQQVRQSTIKDF